MLPAMFTLAESRLSFPADPGSSPASLPEAVRLTALAIVLTVAGGGCGRQSISVSGTVSVDGRPLAEGGVFLAPFAPDGSGTGGGPVMNGRFLVVGSSRLHPGPFKIDLVAFRETGRMLHDTQRGDVPERIPVPLTSILPEIIELHPGENTIAITAYSASGDQPR